MFLINFLNKFNFSRRLLYDRTRFEIPDKQSKNILDEVFSDEIYYKPIPLSKNIKTIIDLGANFGDSTIFFALKYQKATIYAYEPSEKVFKILKRNINRYKFNNKINIYNKAVLSHSKGGLLFCGKSSARSSFMKNAAIVDGFENLEKVQSVSLDSILSKFNKIDLLKIDIEGSEYDLLPQIIANQTRIANIIIECHRAKNKNIFEIPYKLNKYFTIGVSAYPNYPIMSSFLKRPFFGTNMIVIYGKNRQHYHPKYNL